MPAKSVKQRKFMGMVSALQKGKKIAGASAKLKKVAKNMAPGKVEMFAKTKEKGLPPVAKQKRKMVKTLKRSKGSMV